MNNYYILANTSVSITNSYMPDKLKYIGNLSVENPDFMKKHFYAKRYNLRITNLLFLPKVNTKRFALYT